jgi:hypothetical protein
MVTGKAVRFTPGQPGSGLRADVLTALLTSTDAAPKVALRVEGAHIHGAMNLGGRQLVCAAEFRSCVFDDPVYLTKAKAVNLSFRDSTLPGFFAKYATVEQTLNIGHGFRCSGRTVLFGADLGSLEAQNGHFLHPAGEALTADYLTVHGFTTFEGSTFRGAVRFVDAQLQGQLDMTSISVVGPPGDDALNLDSASITGSVFLRKAAVVGPLWLVGLRCSGQLSLESAMVSAHPDFGAETVDASSMSVGGEMLLVDTAVQGGVKARASTFGSLDCTGLRVTGARHRSLDLDSSRVERTFHATFGSLEAALDVTNAQFDEYRDTPGSWPPQLHLGGLRYRIMVGENTDVRTRLRWIAKDNAYHSDAYQQLAASYRNSGDERSGRCALVAGQQARRAVTPGWRRPVVLAWSALLRWLIGYGYEPSRAIAWLAGLIISGSLLSAAAHQHHLITVKPADHGQVFNAWRYTVDLLFPVASLHIAEDFTARGLAVWLVFVLSLSGWFLAAVVVAGLSGVFRKP